MGQMKYTFTDSREWSVKLEGTFNLSKHDFYLQPSLLWEGKPMSIEAGIDLIVGITGTFWGKFDRNDRFFLKAICKF